MSFVWNVGIAGNPVGVIFRMTRTSTTLSYFHIESHRRLSPDATDGERSPWEPLTLAEFHLDEPAWAVDCLQETCKMDDRCGGLGGNCRKLASLRIGAFGKKPSPLFDAVRRLLEEETDGVAIACIMLVVMVVLEMGRSVHIGW